MPPFPPVGFVGRGGGIDQSAIRPEGSGRQADGTTRRVKSKCGSGRGGKGGVERWMDERLCCAGREKGRVFKPGRVVPLEMGLPLGLATLSKSLLL